MLRSTKEKLSALGVITSFWLVIALLGYHFLWFPQMHFRLTDMLHSTSPAETTDVRIVAIDGQSLKPQEEGGLGRWQDWQRSYYAVVIKHLREAGAKVIGVDVFFSEPTSEGREGIMQELLESTTDTLPEDMATKMQQKIVSLAAKDDLLLKDTLSAKPDTVLAASAFGEQDLLLPTKDVTGSGIKIASVSLVEDSDNVLRKVPILTGNGVVPRSFAFALFLAWTGAEYADFSKKDHVLEYIGPPLRSSDGSRRFPKWSFPLDEQMQVLPTFSGRPLTGFPTLSFVDVYKKNFDPSSVTGKIVLIGESDAGLHDDVYTPVSYGQKMPGVEVHAHTVQALIHNHLLQNAPLWIHGLLFLLLALCLGITGLFLGPLWGGALLLVLSLLSLLGSIHAYMEMQLILSLWYLLMPLLGVFASILVYKMFFEEKEKRQALKAFSHYVSDKVAHLMIQNPALLKLGGEKKILTVSFTDIAGFTTLSEQLTPEEITDFLHVYLEKMTEVVLAEDGTLDKYIGDAIMCIFGAPIHQEDHAVRACRAILEMHASIAEIVLKLPMNLPKNMPLSIRSGIATGEMVVGNFGSQKRFDYTVIGDRVNLAARLEGANKEYHSQICVNEETYLAAKHAFVFRSLDILCVKGKKEPVHIYELIGVLGSIRFEQTKMIEEFEHAFILYQQRSFESAREKFREIFQIYGDAASEVYMHRCAYFIENPPAQSWDGSFTMTSK